MLELLTKYAGEVKPGFAPKRARWAILCDRDGRFLNLLELGDTERRNNPGRTFEKAPELSFSELKAGGVKKCHFLIESADVVALLLKENQDEKSVAAVKEKHAYFVKLLGEAFSALPECGLFARLLADREALEKIAADLRAHRAKPTDKVTLAVHGRNPPFLVEFDTWHEWWRSFRQSLAPPREPKKRSAKNGDARMRCFATGELMPPTKVHPKIKGLSDVGGLATGDSLASFKQDSFCSYGFSQSTNAAVSEQGAAAYRAALNRLLEETGRRLANAKVVHWFKQRVARKDDPLAFLEQTEADDERSARTRAQELLDAIRTGTRPDLKDNYYYALTLSGAAGRVMVRDWMEGRFEELLFNINAWFEDLSIIHRSGHGLAPPPKFMAVLGGTVRDLKELPPPFVAGMWRTAVRRGSIPQEALARALHRARVDIIGDRPPNHARMGLIKAYHVRKGDEHMTPGLNEEHPSAAYHCGRLMAVLADLQRSALGDVGAGVVQRFYAAASAAPALVLGRLVRTSQFHLNKLDSPGLVHWYEQRLADIWSRIKDRPPRTLSLEEQSLFAMGYYHQLAARKTKES